MAETPLANQQNSAALNLPNLYRINPLLLRSKNAFKLLQELDAKSRSANDIIQNDEELSKRAKDWALARQIKFLANSGEGADLILERLGMIVLQIRELDDKTAKIIEDYMSKRKTIGDVLRFIYSNLSREKLRVLYVNIDIIIERVSQLEDKSAAKPLLQRLLLLKSIFDRIKSLENRTSIEQQKQKLLDIIQRIERGVINGTWDGFLGKDGIATNTEYYVDLFGSQYNNQAIAGMLNRKKQQYGESRPEMWLGNKSVPNELPDTLWHAYHTYDSFIADRLNKLWENSYRIAESIRLIMESLFGKNPSIALGEIKQRLPKLEKKIKKEWEKKRANALELFIEADIDAESALEIIGSIKEKYANYFGDRALYVKQSYSSNFGHGNNAERLTSARKKPDFSILGYILLTSKLFENNVKGRLNVAESLTKPVAIEQRLISEFAKSVRLALASYQKFFQYVESLELGIPNLQINDKIQGLKGA
ncbi:hypothetical protein HYX05_00935 [Candidatus Woesearchaeota archaeon]|nr:hypothetical protein [Candidatus Woesearchaeota archaeon]